MKKLLTTTIIITLLSLFTSCKKDNIFIDKTGLYSGTLNTDMFVPESFYYKNKVTVQLNELKDSYYIENLDWTISKSNMKVTGSILGEPFTGEAFWVDKKTIFISVRTERKVVSTGYIEYRQRLEVTKKE